ncbi:hypothetical protein DRN85_07305, partial [Methanosarcinales archaeon]
MGCYNLGESPTGLFANQTEADLYAGPPIVMQGFHYLVLAPGNNGSIQRSLTALAGSTTVTDSCDYYQCFVYNDINDWPTGCGPIEESLAFYVENSPPTINIPPSIVTYSDHLFCDADPSIASFDDPDDDGVGSPINFTWLVNGEEVGAGLPLNELSDTFYGPGDNVTCVVSIPDNSTCPQRYSNKLNYTYYVPIAGWVHVNYHPTGYTNYSYYCDFEYQMPPSGSYNITTTWYIFDDWTGDWSTSTLSDTIVLPSFIDSSSNHTSNPLTQLNSSYLEKCHYIACEAYVDDLAGSNLTGNSTAPEDASPIAGQGSTAEIINHAPVLTGDVTVDIQSTSPLTLYCNISNVEFTDADVNDPQDDIFYQWYDPSDPISGEVFQTYIITDLPEEGGTYRCCAEMFDSIINGNCQDSDTLCGEITIPPRSLTFTVNLSADPITDQSPPPGYMGGPIYTDTCSPILPEETREDNCAYEDSNFTCSVHNIDYSGHFTEDDIVRMDMIIYDNEGNTFVEETVYDTDDIVYYWNEDPVGIYEGCLENPDCQKGDRLYCNATLYDAHGPLATVTSNPVLIHNFIPQITKPEILVITEAFPVEGVQIGDYNGTILKNNYINRFVCVPNDTWTDDDRTPDYNNDLWNEVEYYWEWSPIDTGYVTVPGCDYETDYSNLCSNNECFENAEKIYLCDLADNRSSICLVSPTNISCWGPDEDNESHWLPFNPMEHLVPYDAFKFIPNMNVSYGVCDWASLGGLTGCPPADEFTLDCSDGVFIVDPTDDSSVCRGDLYTGEMQLLRQCSQGTRDCYELLENCTFDSSWVPGMPVPSGYDCPAGTYLTIAGLDVTPEDFDPADPFESAGNWTYNCSGLLCGGEYAGTYIFWHTSWHIRGPYIALTTPYMTEACPCSSNDYFERKDYNNLPSFSIFNTYLSDINALFYEREKPHGIPLRCCINMSDQGFESTFSNPACSDPSCGNFLDCGNCFYDEDGNFSCYSNARCISSMETSCYMYLQDSCSGEILWNATIDACAGINITDACYYNYTNGTAFRIIRKLDLATGETIVEQTDEIQECYPCMQYWPMEGDADFNANDFNDEWGYYYHPWWFRDYLWNESYAPQTGDPIEELPEPDKISLFDDAVSFENIIINDTERMEYPCDPNEDENCTISLHDWWAGPWGAQQNDTLTCEGIAQPWALLSANANEAQLKMMYGLPDEMNIVGRFFAAGFTYCNQWDEAYMQDLVDYTDHDLIESSYGNYWPRWEQSFMFAGGDSYPWLGRAEQPGYITSGRFNPENSIVPGLVWNAEWPEGMEQYEELTCDNYSQCRKHARISADHVFGIVYNTTHNHISCECPEGLDESDCTASFGPANAAENCGKWSTEMVWEFNERTCSCNCACPTPRPDPPPELDCGAIGKILFYNDVLCRWECRDPVSGPSPPVPGGEEGIGYGTGIHWAEEEEYPIDEMFPYVLFADENGVSESYEDARYEDAGYEDARFEDDRAASLPMCSWTELQTPGDNCFISDAYFNAIYDYSLSHNVSDLNVYSSSVPIDLSGGVPSGYEDYILDGSFFEGRTLWDTSSCTAYIDERLGVILDNNYLNETENEGCGFCQGLLINNTAPEIHNLSITANPAETQFNCTISGFYDIDTHPADEIKEATFRWCNDDNCTTVFAEETVSGSDPYSIYTDSSLPIDPETGDPIIYCCAKVNDTDWESKESEEYCQAYTAVPEVCNITLDGISDIYIFDPSSIEEYIVTDNYTFTPEELPYRIADLHLIYESEDIGAISCYQTTEGINCPLTYSGHPEIVIGELDLGEYQIIANNSEKGCYPDSKTFNIVTGTPVTNCSVLDIPNTYYYLANDINVTGTAGTGCPATLETTTPNLDKFVNYYSGCHHCCVIIDADNVTFDLAGHVINSDVPFPITIDPSDPAGLNRLGGICALEKEG